MMQTRLADRLNQIASQYDLTAIYAFGSRSREIAGDVRGEAFRFERGTSDVDIGVQTGRGEQLSVLEKVDLTLALEDCFGVARVDLVVVNETSPFLALDVVSGELLACTDPDEQAEYELYVLRRAGDLAPFERERRELILSGGAR